MEKEISIRNNFNSRLFVGLAACLLASAVFYRTWSGRNTKEIVASLPALVAPKKETITKDHVAELVGKHLAANQFPTDIELPDGAGKGIVQYALDPILQEEMETLMRTYRPDYGAFVAMDASTGQILALVSYTNSSMKENLALRATYPSASVFKVVTAAAAIENRKLSPDSVVSFSGANHTLYRSNILKTTYNRWTRHTTLKDAFAKSINTVFGRIGAYTVGTEHLRQYADRFGFNRAIAADLPVQPGRAPIPEDLWGLAEAASGYTRENTMSPVQGALIAASVVNGGVMMEPYVVQSVFSQDGSEMYGAKSKIAKVVLDPQTAREMRELMRETVARGTSKKSFRGFFRGKMTELDVGGKTGSLTGMDPPGKYDWFVGFAEGGNRKLAIAALTVHEKFWRVKSSYLARRAIENYFR